VENANPGSFTAFESDKENDQFALDLPREIWFTSFRFAPSSMRDTFESMREKIRASNPEYLIDREDYVAKATITKKHRHTGEDYFLLSSSNSCPGNWSVCSILFSQPDHKEWALETWRSIQPPANSET